MLEYGELRIDARARKVVVGERHIETTMKEFDLLTFLASAPRQVFTREQLGDAAHSSRRCPLSRVALSALRRSWLPHRSWPQ